MRNNADHLDWVSGVAGRLGLGDCLDRDLLLCADVEWHLRLLLPLEVLVENTNLCFRWNFLRLFDSDVDLARILIASSRFALGFNPLNFLDDMRALLS